MNINMIKILDLLNKANNPISATKLAIFLSVSNRSIRNYIQLLRKEGYDIKASKNGYYLLKHFDFDIKHQKCIFNQSIENRVDYIIEKVLLSKEGIDIYDLADGLYISYSTIEKDLLNVRKRLEIYNLEFQRKNGIITLIGSEKNKRKLISFLLTENSDSIINNTIEQLCTMINIEYKKIESSVKFILSDNNLYVSDYGLRSILIHIIVSLVRITVNDFRLDQTLYTIKNKKAIEYLCASSIYKQLQELTHIEWNEYEVEILAFIIATKTTSLYKQENEFKICANFDTEINDFVHKLVLEINSIYYIDLNDNDFFNFFTLHLINAIYRAQNNVFYPNPFSNKIYIQNPLIYDIAVYIATRTKKEFGYDFNRDEITFFSLHIGSVIEKNQKIANSLNAILIIDNYYQYFSDNKIINTLNDKLVNKCKIITVTNNDRIPNQDLFDFAIDASSIKNHYDFPCICVSAIFTEKDIIDIIDFSQQLLTKRENTTFKTKLSALFDDNFFLKNHYENSPLDMIKYMSSAMIKDKLAPKEFTESVIERELITPTSFDNKIAIPHSILCSTAKNCGFIIINEKPMKWGFFDVQIIILIGINHNQRFEFKNIYQKLLDCFFDTNIVNKVIKSNSVEDFINVLICKNEH